MDKAALVKTDFAIGTEVFEALKNSDLEIDVALWVRFSEYGDWRFLLSSRRLDQLEPLKAYRLVHDVLKQASFPLEYMPPLLILKRTDSFIKDLRRIFGKAKNVEGMRLGGQMIGDRFIEDAVVYRIQ